ncbi:MAG TPA: hypothetical protein VEW25_11280 [Allosphingosinicella sp.]|nr:hypothetical protein [Allosphingosinicella sp.]
MNKLLIALTAGSAIAVAAPAAAQWGNQNQNQTDVNARAAANVETRIAQLETRLQAGIQSGAIDRTEARTLRTQVRALTRLQYQYSRNGLTQQERQDLQQRLRSVRQQFRLADGGGNGRWADNDDNYYPGQSGYPGQGGYTGQGGAYEEIRECDGNNGGIVGGVIGGIFGRGNNNSDCVDAGDRAPANLSAVPYELRNQFRDGNGIAYRTDGQRIYQIDVRSNTVLRVYAAQR